MNIDLQKGTILGETYQLISLIGRGGMGDVWLAQHTRLPRQVAVKVLHGAARANKTVIARFRREAEIASRLGHGNIVEVFDFNVLADGTPYMVMELLEGQSLRDRVSRGPLSLGEAVAVLRQLASGLKEAHAQGIVHRDLKPDNIFLCQETIGDKTFDRIKILDFGISKIRGAQTMLTQDAEVLGTPLYMSPEQAAGQHDRIDGRTDQFALGAIAYELLTGETAFAGHTLAEVVNKIINGAPTPIERVVGDVPAHVTQAIDRAISKDVGKRFATIVDFVDALAGDVPSAKLETIPLPERSPTADTRPDDAMAPTLDSQRLSGGVVPQQAAGGAPGAISGLENTAAAPLSPRTGPSLTTQPSAAPQDAPTTGLKWGLIAGALVAGLAVVAGAVFAVGSLDDRKDGATASSSQDGATGRDSMPPKAAVDATPGGEVSVSADAGASSRAADGGPLAADGGPLAADGSTARAADARVSPTNPKASSRKGDKRRAKPRSARLPPEVATDLREAKRALARGAYDEAYGLAKRALSRRRTPQAFSIMARVHCVKRDLRLAKAMLRQLPRGQRRRAVAWCRRKGFDPDPR